MRIVGKDKIEPLRFRDLRVGDTFCEVENLKDILKRRIFIKCLTTTGEAIDIETGIMYTIGIDTPVQKVNGIFQILGGEE